MNLSCEEIRAHVEISNHNIAIMVAGIKALNKLDLWVWIRSYNPPDGFVWDEHENTKKITSEIDNVLLSSEAFGYCMRRLQQIATVMIDDDGKKKF
jgi:hypothetical protein